MKGEPPEIRTVPIEYTIFGHSLRHDPAKRFGEEIMSPLNRVWPVIKAGRTAPARIRPAVLTRRAKGCSARTALQRQLTIIRLIFFDNGIAWRATGAHGLANYCKSLFTIGNFNIEAAECDAVAYTQLRSAARNLAKISKRFYE